MSKTKQMPQNTIVRTLLTLLICICGIGIILFVGEQYFRLQQDQKITELLSHDHFIWMKNLSPNSSPNFTPKQKDVLDSFQLEIKDYTTTTDSFGFIVTARNHTNPDLKFAFFGGSTAQCLFVDEDKRMPEAVARIVEKKTGRKINAWNCAAGGTHSYHTLNVLNNLALSLNPDYAFFYGNANDLGVLMNYGTYFNPNPDKGILFSIPEYQKRHGIKTDGILPYTIGAFKTKFNLKTSKDDFAEVRDVKLTLDSAVIMSQVVRVFRTLISVCKANSIKPVIITQRNNFDNLNYEWLRKNMPLFKPTANEYIKVKLLFHQYNNCLRQIAIEENVMLIDLDGATLGFENFYDAIHFNNKGSLAISETIAVQFIGKLKADGSLLLAKTKK